MYSNTIIKRNSYFDSVTLMSLGSKIKAISGVDEAVVVMATDMNKEILMNVGLGSEDTQNASQNDMVIAIRAENENIYKEAYSLVEEKLSRGGNESSGKTEEEYKSIKHALKAFPNANIAVLSVPGKYAAREARIALENNMHVMMFSDNVTIENELSLKSLAAEKELLMMGPDCGTAVINGIGLCFSNKVRSGNIGIVGASGTGLQEVLTQIHRLGGGISQALGTGGRDLSKAIGGIMMIQGIKALAEDEKTDVIVIVSKPPEKSVEDKIFNLLNDIDKPVVVSFLEGDMSRTCRDGIYLYDTLLVAAKKAVELSGISNIIEEVSYEVRYQNVIAEAKAMLQENQSKLCGLYCGGTLCAEALSVLRNRVDSIRCNVSHHDEEMISGSESCDTNLLLDLGDDEFTNGRPHPMIEPNLRNSWIVSQALRPEIGVIILDFEIGYGSHIDPVGETISAIREAKEKAAAQGRNLSFVAYLCGTEVDKQDIHEQESKLQQEGVILSVSNIDAVKIAADIISK